MSADYEVLENLVDIIDNYVSKESSYQVNISHLAAKRVYEAAEEFERNIEARFEKMQELGNVSNGTSDESLSSERTSLGDLELGRRSSAEILPQKKHKRVRSAISSEGQVLSKLTVPTVVMDVQEMKSSIRRFRRTNSSKNLTNPTWQDFVDEQKLLKQLTENQGESKDSNPSETQQSQDLESGVLRKKDEGHRHKRALSASNLLTNYTSTEPNKLERKSSRQELLCQHSIVTIFDNALLEIFELMKSDSFIRFRNSQLYRDFFKCVQEEENQKQSLRDLKLIS
jgi:hypothetical protein